MKEKAIRRSRGLLIVAIVLLVAASIFIVQHRQGCDGQKFPQIDSYQQVLHLLKQCNANTLVLFDVDDTLISAYDVMARDFDWPLSFWVRALFWHPSLITTPGWEHFCGIMFQQSKRFIIEPELPQIINDLKDRGCMVIGLTSMESGVLGVIPNMPEWRFEMLKDFGIQMSRSFPDASFRTLPQYRNNYPMLYKGILCCNQQNKGDVLGAFLDYFKLSPQNIVFFDDYPRYVRSVAEQCAKRKITLYGFEYTRKKKLSGVWGTGRALLQLDYVMDHARWLSDEEADGLLVGLGQQLGADKA
jgi:hypothetical protein